jgi:hypothetical protein
MTQKKQQSRRDFIKKSAYAAPAVLSFTAMPAFATLGSVAETPSDEPAPPPEVDDEPAPPMYN